MTLNMFLGQRCCICTKEDNFDLKGSETDVTGILEVLFLHMHLCIICLVGLIAIHSLCYMVVNLSDFK